MRKGFGITIALTIVLGGATSSFAQEVVKVNAQKVNTSTLSTSTSVINSNIDQVTRPKPPGPGGTDAILLHPGVNFNSNIDSRVRPKPKGPGGTEALQQIRSINQVQH
ncbi:hypothetical protein NIES4071_05250 [Calothrix sp. NIES-4071]|nr:hypothetical protein NIES4071_05250 [Calothrix sp. NIES-4071]BAZ54871.1 hypothetical protein NIES4105_05240 [Calothrix sp. NIES-4105]